ncbi:hypothetical protein NLG97_g4246 [Lecanicillium saksenae]|uniref:Uncharacterized protein n=1 Tax=Lecanicillium saksenae TaxID=468837 RepID=A0ACC1QYF3_9HYPO|nr:hypothetical protein NLG97_g4246 [Lecanicillium saksenae]
MDDLRFRQQQQQSSRNDLPISSLVSPSRNGASRMVQQQPLPHDHRANLPRRFTTDSGRVPTLSSMTSPAKGPELSHDYSSHVSIPTWFAQASVLSITATSKRCTKFNWYVPSSDTMS